MRESSLCTAPPYGRDCDAALWQHMHCLGQPGCETVLFALGDGGHEDVDGNSASVCSECGDAFFVLCRSCAQVDSRCAVCRRAAAEQAA